MLHVFRATSSQFLEVLDMPFRESFSLGPFSVDSEGRLSPADADVTPGFSVRWRSRVVHACLVRTDAQYGHMSIRSHLGRIPSTASDPAKRAACLAMVRTLSSSLPEAWAVRLFPDHQPRLEVQTTVALPITITNLVTELSLFLLRLSHYLDLMDSAGFQVIASQPGAIAAGRSVAGE
jgi:hypothetical protein